MQSSRKLTWQILSAVVLLIAAVLLPAACAQQSAGLPQLMQTRPPASTGTVAQGNALYDENLVISLYEKCMPAVVQIETETSLPPLSNLPGPFRLEIPRRTGQGSGFFIDGDGHIITNNHVVDKATEVRVTLDDGTRVQARVIGNDRNNDLALLKVDPAKVPQLDYLPLGDSDKIKPGQMAIALGSPFGLQGSITVGVVSGIGRSIAGATERQIIGMIQTDAAINPGNSGGPLLNSSGEVIGVNAMIEAMANGVGFAIPVNLMKTDLEQLKKGGSIKTAWLGIEGQPVTADLAGKLSLPVEKGVYIVSVVAGSPAEKAGLKEGGRDKTNEAAAGGDIITAIEGKPVTKVQDLISYFNSKRPGDRVTLTVQRGNEVISVVAELAEWPEKLPSSSKFDMPQDQDGDKEFNFGPFYFRWR